jgi:threonyl-tRNA synthetase
LFIVVCFIYKQSLSECLDDFGMKWTLNPGDGAFYGPKVSAYNSDQNMTKNLKKVLCM